MDGPAAPDAAAAKRAPRLEASGALAAIERERYRSYSDLVRNLHWLAAALVVLYALLAPRAERRLLETLAGGMVLYTLALHSPLLGRVPYRVRVVVETLADLAWTTAVVVLTGAAASPFHFLYFMVLFASNPAEGRGWIYGKAAAATLLLVAVPGIAAGGPPPPLEALRDVLWPLAALWLVAYFTAEAGTLGATVERSLYLAAHTDELTGLTNMRHFTAAADLRGRLGEPYTIVMIDADGLKRVNDTYGHARGSELIQRVATALRKAARSGDDLCARLGGDEFIVRLAGASPEGAEAYCGRVRRWLAENPVDLGDGSVLQVSVSMGAASFPEHGRTLPEVSERADQALYLAKREGRAQDAIWSPTGRHARLFG